MAKVTIFVTPTSITIYDGNQNRLIVRKGENDIEFHSTADSVKASNNILSLQQAIRGELKKKSKDNYRVRFDKLAKHLSAIKTHSFITLKNQLVCD